MPKIIFTYEQKKTEIQCLKENTMKDICNKYASKIGIDINSLTFLFDGNKINLKLTYNQIFKRLDKDKKEIKI